MLLNNHHDSRAQGKVDQDGRRGYPNVSSFTKSGFNYGYNNNMCRTFNDCKEPGCEMFFS